MTGLLVSSSLKKPKAPHSEIFKRNTGIDRRHQHAHGRGRRPGIGGGGAGVGTGGGANGHIFFEQRSANHAAVIEQPCDRAGDALGSS